MILVVDNYDSFTFNLVQFLGELGASMTVKRNDEMTVGEVLTMAPERIVVSPGPCTPSEAGICVDLIRAMAGRTPILGVCLGHQSIAEAYGGRTVRATRTVHGKVSPIRHNGDPIFAGIPSPMLVTRYHSLVASSPLPRGLEPIAWSNDPADGGEIQALRHRAHPVWGVQFHPESWFTEGGRRLLRNFLGLART